SWEADRAAVNELTDLDNIITGGLTCTLESIAPVGKTRQARVSFKGKIRGVDEDGNARHELDGSLFFDIDARLISYVTLEGEHFLLDKDGNTVGKIKGSFTLARDPSRTPALANAAMAGLKLEPNAENTLLRFDDPALGIR